MDTPTPSPVPTKKPVATAPPVPSAPVVKRVAALAPSAAVAAPVDPSLLMPGDEEPSPEEAPHHAGGFWAQPWVQNVLPLATSLALHIGIIVLGIALYKAVEEVASPAKQQVIIPETKNVGPNKMPGGIPHPGDGGDKTRDAAQDLLKDVKDPSFDQNPTNKTALAAAAGGGSAGEDGSEFQGGNTGAGKGGGVGTGNGQFAGSGGGGGAAPFGVPGGGMGSGPPSEFLGVPGGNANRIVFLCDASGSMLSVYASLKSQLKQSVTDLDVTQEFNIIFFYDDQSPRLFQQGPQFATPENKQLAINFIDNSICTGGTLPLNAIKEAMKEKPDLLWVSTDGFDQIASFDEVIKAFHDGNTDGKMHINCIFLQADEDPKLVEVLTKIAHDNNGKFVPILKSSMN